jgi:glutamate racemase
MVVIACNTATSAAAGRIRDKYAIPIIGMEPAIKPALLSNKGGRIAVMATEMTLKLDKFNFLIEGLKGKGKILKIPAPELVRLVEAGITDGPLVQDYLKTLFKAHDLEKIESVVLGCTHFLYCESSIQSFFNHGVKIFDGHQGTVNHVIDLLEEHDLLETRGPGGYEIINTKSEAMKNQSRILLDQYLNLKR